MPARACVGWKPPVRDVSVAGEGAIWGGGVMRIVAAAMATGLVAGLASFVEAQSPSDPPGLTCVTWQNQWRAEGANMTLAQATAFRGRVPAACAGTRAAVQVRIDALSRAAAQQPAQPPPDPCANANAAWAYLSRSSDRAALQAFINDTPAQCAVRGQAQTRLNSLPRETATRPPQQTTTLPQQQPAQTRPIEPALRAGQTFRDCDFCPEMVVIPAGSFTMGSPDSESGRDSDEGPQRRVSIRAFAVGKFEVTWDQWLACVNRGGCSAYTPADYGYGRGTRPVISVSWENARDYVLWLSRETRQSYRLLTEAEWEYAARAGTDTPYPWGYTASHEYANYGADRCCSGLAQGRDQWVNTSPVGSFPANAFGLHDMHGNVWEWVQDCYASSYSGLPTDGSAHETNSCSNRVNRGGGWYGSPRDLRSAYRFRSTPAARSDKLGFRVARTLN